MARRISEEDLAFFRSNEDGAFAFLNRFGGEKYVDRFEAIYEGEQLTDQLLANTERILIAGDLKEIDRTIELLEKRKLHNHHEYLVTAKNAEERYEVYKNNNPFFLLGNKLTATLMSYSVEGIAAGLITAGTFDIWKNVGAMAQAVGNIPLMATALVVGAGIGVMGKMDNLNINLSSDVLSGLSESYHHHMSTPHALRDIQESSAKTKYANMPLLKAYTQLAAEHPEKTQELKKQSYEQVSSSLQKLSGPTRRLALYFDIQDLVELHTQISQLEQQGITSPQLDLKMTPVLGEIAMNNPQYAGPSTAVSAIDPNRIKQTAQSLYSELSNAIRTTWHIANKDVNVAIPEIGKHLAEGVAHSVNRVADVMEQVGVNQSRQRLNETLKKQPIELPPILVSPMHSDADEPWVKNIKVQSSSAPSNTASLDSKVPDQSGMKMLNLGAHRERVNASKEPSVSEVPPMPVKALRA